MKIIVKTICFRTKGPSVCGWERNYFKRSKRSSFEIHIFFFFLSTNAWAENTVADCYIHNMFLNGLSLDTRHIMFVIDY